MMMGVAQVIGMKPIFRSVFSGLPVCANTSVAVAMGKKVETAAAAVDAPTAFRKPRRCMSFGNSARITADVVISR